VLIVSAHCYGKARMLYAIPIVIVALVIPAFFTIGYRRFSDHGRTQTWLSPIVALPLLLSAFGHFLRTALYASIIPSIFPHPHLLVIVTGIFEGAGAIGILIPATRRLASLSLAVLMVAVFPANVYIAGQTIGGMHMPGVGLRTAMQVFFIVLILLAGWGIPEREEAQKL
jgi:uncharacterized membrane protein